MLLSPGLLLQLPDTLKLSTLKTSTRSVMFHALVFMLTYRLVARLLNIVLVPTDLVVPTILFILLSPGLFLTLPPGSGGVLMSGKTGLTSIATHTLVFAVAFAFLRKTFPQYY
jgi:hypothetical protein